MLHARHSILKYSASNSNTIYERKSPNFEPLNEGIHIKDSTKLKIFSLVSRVICAILPINSVLFLFTALVLVRSNVQRNTTRIRISITKERDGKIIWWQKSSEGLDTDQTSCLKESHAV